MKKKFKIRQASLQTKIILLVLAMLTTIVVVFSVVADYQSQTLAHVVSQTRAEQQAVVSRTLNFTMDQVMKSTVVNTATLRAGIADNDFAEIVHAHGNFCGRWPVKAQAWSGKAPAPVICAPNCVRSIGCLSILTCLQQLSRIRNPS